MRTLLRILRTFTAGVFGALRGLLVLALILALAVPLARATFTWYARGSFTILPRQSEARPRVNVVDATPAESKAIEEAASKLRYKVPPNVTFGVVKTIGCPDCAGEYVPLLRLILIPVYMVEGDPHQLRRAVAHELGHYVDQEYLDRPARLEFMAMRRIPERLGWTSTGTDWAERPSEDFAEVFAALALPSTIIPPQTVYGPVRDPRSFEALLARAGVGFAKEVPAPTLGQAARAELDFFVQALEQRPTGRVFAVLVVLYAAWFAGNAMRRAWVLAR